MDCCLLLKGKAGRDMNWLKQLQHNIIGYVPLLYRSNYFLEKVSGMPVNIILLEGLKITFNFIVVAYKLSKNFSSILTYLIPKISCIIANKEHTAKYDI